MKERKLILLSLSIPVLFVLLALFKSFLEYYFRFSEKYRYVYTAGATISFFGQLLLILSSFTLGIYIIVNRKQFTWKTKTLSLLFGLSLFVYFVILIAVGFIIM
jgi:hypothetical protein